MVNTLLLERQVNCDNGIYQAIKSTLAFGSLALDGNILSKPNIYNLLVFDGIVANQETAIPVTDILYGHNFFVAFDKVLTSIDVPLTYDFFTCLYDEITSIPVSLSNYRPQPEIISQDDVNKIIIRYNECNDKFNGLIHFGHSLVKCLPMSNRYSTVNLLLFKECCRNDILPFVLDVDILKFSFEDCVAFVKQQQENFCKNFCLDSLE